MNRDAAYRLGLSMGLIDQTLYDAFGQEQVTTVYTDTAQHKVILEVEPRFQDDPSALSHIYVKSTWELRYRCRRSRTTARPSSRRQ